MLSPQVPVKDALCMAVRKAVQKLRKKAPRLGLRHAPPLAPVSQAPSTGVLHLRVTSDHVSAFVILQPMLILTLDAI